MKVTVLGTGRWASFHAWYQATVLKNAVLVWGRADGFYKELSTTYKNDFLTLPKCVKFTTDLGAAIESADYIIISIWAQSMPEFSAQLAQFKPKNKTFVLCMKGVVDTTGERLSVVLTREIDKTNRVVVWVGPGHPVELVSGQPNVMLIDGTDRAAVEEVTDRFRSKLVRLYEGNDIIGSEIGAAAKNVVGICAGILDGANMTSLKGALMARGAYEVAKLIVAMGGSQLTAYGISHLGDYEATLFSKNSRNRSYGEAFFRGEKVEYVAEGVATTKALRLLAEKYKVDMPICSGCYEILYDKKDARTVLDKLFERENAKEFRF
jgi:glycerol-3-phosphate dehydrogenase (NAD(P)+)